MSLKLLLDDLYIDIPNQFYDYFEFEKAALCMSLSSTGTILGVGLDSGDIILLDSETGENRMYLPPHAAPVTSISISDDGFLVSSGDSKGLMRITQVLTSDIVFSHQFESKILNLAFSKSGYEQVFVLEANKTLHMISLEDMSIKKVSSDVSAVCWNIKYSHFVAASGKEVLFYDKDFNVVSTVEVERSRGITALVPSNTGKFLLVFDRQGVVHVYKNEANKFIHRLKDPIGDSKFNHGVFDRADEHIILSSDSRRCCKLPIYEIESGRLLLELEGRTPDAKALIFSPCHPVIFALQSKFISVWTATYHNSWEKMDPGFTYVDENVVYYEKEDEFDDVDSEETPECQEPEEEFEVFPPSERETTHEVLRNLPIRINDLVAANADSK